MDQIKSEFKIVAANKNAALTALKELSSKQRLSWIDASKIERANTLEEALEETRWMPKNSIVDPKTVYGISDVKNDLERLETILNENNSNLVLGRDLVAGMLRRLNGPSDPDIIGISFEGEKMGSEDTFFSVLAPFVEAGSFIEMRGEDGETWRWVFDGQTVQQKQPNVKWD